MAHGDNRNNLMNTATVLKPSAEAGKTPALAGKHLTFKLDAESYGIPVIKVREIIRLIPITAVPQVPAYVKGVINLRGKIIPVVDLRIRFGLGAGSNSDSTCIVVVQVQLAGARNLAMGLIVDAVEEVVNIMPEDIEETPDFGTQVDATYILGMAKVKGQVKALIDIDRVLAGTSLLNS